MENFWIIAFISALCLALGFFAGVFWQSRRGGASSGPVADQVELLTRRTLDQATRQLAQTNEQVLQRINQHVSHEKELSSQSLGALVNPIARTLTELRGELNRLQEETKHTHGRMHEQLRLVNDSTVQLQAQTQSLVGALNSSNTRGQWGEVQLRRIVESAGMLDRVDFFTQDHRSSDAGAIRPDMVVKLAGGKHIVIDAKVPLSAFLDAFETEDLTEQREHFQLHAKQLRQQIVELSKKKYWTGYDNSPEFVVIFLPSEAILSHAQQVDADLFEFAMSKQVVLTTPSTLLALLRTVAYAWRQDALAENAQDILRLGKLLHERLSTMGTHLTDLGKKISQSTESYNRLVGSIESRVLPAARRFGEMGISDESVRDIPPLHPQPRPLTAQEFMDNS